MDRLIIILSDIHIDKPAAREKLRALLEGYAMMEPPPSCFVFLGNFFSQVIPTAPHTRPRPAAGSGDGPA